MVATISAATVLSGLSLAVTAVGVVNQQKAAKKQARFARQAAKDRKEGAAISQAQGKIQDKFSRRQKIREERVRRAQILQGAEGGGVGGSSGAIGATSVLGTNTANVIAGSLGASKARTGLANANQSAANAIASGQQAGARADLFASQLGLVQGGLSFASKLDLFAAPTVSITQPSSSTSIGFQGLRGPSGLSLG